MHKIDKGECLACGRKIQVTLLDKCMYCGAPLKADQRFTDEEKRRIRCSREGQQQELERTKLKFSKADNNHGIFDIIDFNVIDL